MIISLQLESRAALGMETVVLSAVLLYLPGHCSSPV